MNPRDTKQVPGILHFPPHKYISSLLIPKNLLIYIWIEIHSINEQILITKIKKEITLRKYR